MPAKMTLTSRSLLRLVTRQQCSQTACQAGVDSDMMHCISALSQHWGRMRCYSTDGQNVQPSIFAACLLERLPILKSPPPEWEAEYKAWTQLRKSNEGMIKQYPILDKKQKSRDDSEQTSPDLAPSQTKADEKGIVSTMKRRLTDKLVLLVKARHDPTAAAAIGSKAAAQTVWTFPFTAHKAGETIRGAAERALKEAIGPSQVYFVGNAPMAHLDLRSSLHSSGSSSSSSHQQEAAADTDAQAAASTRRRKRQRPDGRVFFHLATVVNDPWDVAVVDGVASDHAWVSKEELGQYIKDERLLALAHQML